MAISVIVSNFNGARFLPRLLDTLKAQRGVTLEIIVVDRDSSDDSAAILSGHGDVTVVSEPPESGLASGYAAGVRRARHDHLFFCNEDMWFDPDCLARLESHIDLARKVACVDPWQWSYDGKSELPRGVQVRRRWNRGSPHPFHELSSNRELPAGSITAMACAGAMMVHRFAYDDAGGWDRSFFLDHEDTDLAIRLWQRGWWSVVEPGAKVYHAVGGSNTNILPGTNVQVGEKRYVLSISNQIVLAWKLFSPRFALLPVLPWLEKLIKNLLMGRWRMAGWDVLAMKSAISRLPAAIEFRRRHRIAMRSRPGEGFFAEPKFQFGAVARPRPVASVDQADSYRCD